MTDDLSALLFERGPATMASALATLMNHAMPIEHGQVLMTVSHQRSADRRGYANGFKPTTVNTRFGRIDLRMTRTCDYRGVNGRPSYPRSLEQGVRTTSGTVLPRANSTSASRSWPMIGSAAGFFPRGICCPPFGCTTQRFSL